MRSRNDITIKIQQCYEPGRQIGEDSETAWVRCSEDYECASKCIKVNPNILGTIEFCALSIIQQVANRFRLKCYGKSDCETVGN